jgi:PAS domain S-box-containing protein
MSSHRPGAPEFTDAEKYRQISYSGVIGMVVFDTAGRLHDANDAFLRMAGYSREDVQVGRLRWDQLTPPEWMPRTRLALEEFERSGRITPYEKQYFKSDGQRFWGLFGGARLDNSDRGVSFVLDISERKRTEAQLQVNRQLIEAVIEHLPNGVALVCGKELSYLLVNPAYQAIAPGKPMLGLGIQEVWPEWQPWFAERCRNVLATGEPYHAINEAFQVRRSVAGVLETLYFSWSIHRVRLPDHDGWSLLITSQETTEHKRAEEALRESEERYRAMVNQAATGVALAEAGTGRFVFVNQFYCDLTGYTQAELLQLRLQDLTHPDDRPRSRELFDRLARQGTAYDIEKRFVRKDGSHIWVHNGVTVIRDAGGEPHRVLAVTVDITARKQAEEALREANQRKDDFLATLAHELRNPLAPIRNSLAILRVSGGTDPTAQRVQEMMQRQVNHMVRLVDDLLEVSRITRGNVELRREWVDLAAIINGAVETSKPLIERAGHRLTLYLPAQPVMLDADPVRLAQVFANLLNNAAKYTPVTPAAGHIWLSAWQEGQEAVVSVRDTGLGIEPQMLQRVFDMFTQAVPGQGGLGIGLSLARSLVHLHGGSVEARSEGLGKGSEFIVRLPLGRPPESAAAPAPAAPAAPVPAPVAAAAAAAPPQAAATSQPPPPATELRRVLVVDDNRDAAESLAMLLRIIGAEADVVYDGTSALARLPVYRPHVVVLDLGMPGLDGYEVARRIRALPEHSTTTLIALSGWGKEEDRRRSGAAGFDHHLIKPADIGTLQSLLGTREPPAPHPNAPQRT